MSYSYERYDRRRQGGRAGSASQRTGLGYWVPLTLTVTATLVGFAAWIWSERRDTDNGDEDLIYERREKRKRRDERSSQQPPPSFHSEPQPRETALGQQESSSFQAQGDIELSEERSYTQGAADEGILSRASGAIKRTPSPQQLFDGASKRVVAGVAAVGAAVGKGLTAIRETSDDDYQDHERWSEEVENPTRDSSTAAVGTAATAVGAAVSTRSMTDKSQAQPRGKRRTVAVVVSAATDDGPDADESTAYNTDHASILSHLPPTINTSTTQLIVLIYAPHLLSHPLSANTAPDPSNQSYARAVAAKPGAAASDASYSNVSTPAVEAEQPTFTAPEASEGAVANPPNALYTALMLRASALVEHPTHVLPFTTPTGHVYILRHLAPSLVYMQESLCGSEGDVVKQIDGWVGQVMVVIGSEGAGGGLVDTETEDEGQGKEKVGRGEWKWWMDDGRVGLGKGVDVVEAMRVEEDWGKRVGS